MQYQSTQSYTPVISATEDVRATFLVKVYQHLGLAIGLFVLFEFILFSLGVDQIMYDFIARNGSIAWLGILGGVGIVSMIASRSAHNLENPAMQYGALVAMALAEALIFAPMLHRAFQKESGNSTVVSAIFITAVGFAGLSIIAMVTKKDLSFMRPILMWVGFGALGLIVASLVFGFNLGTIFSVAMIVFAGASILYSTQRIYKEYPEWAFVGAAVSLFASLMTMFWYVLRILDR